MSSAAWVCMVRMLHGSCKLCCEILLLLNVADMDCLLHGRLWSGIAEYRVHLVSVDRVIVLCIVGKMAQDVGMV